MDSGEPRPQQVEPGDPEARAERERTQLLPPGAGKLMGERVPGGASKLSCCESEAGVGCEPSSRASHTSVLPLRESATQQPNETPFSSLLGRKWEFA